MGGMISNNPESGEEPVAGINVTSLVDIMFCLLIMFMVATPLMSKEELELELPLAKGVEMSDVEMETTMIAVDANGRVFMGTLPLDENKEKWVEQIGANPVLKEAGIAFLVGDENVPFGTIVDVMDALKKAGIHEVGFVTDPKVDAKKKSKKSKKSKKK
jgi:biopolymer transport protein ExbD